MKSALKRHGGKAYHAGRIVRLMPPHTHYHEPFFGSGAVLFAKPPEGSEVVNDLDGELTNFWHVLREPELFATFHRLVLLTPLGRAEFERARLPASSEVERAASFFIRNRQSRQALGRDFVTPTQRTRRDMNEHASALLSAVDRLPEVHQRLRGVEIDCRPAVESIRRRDHAGCLHYLDPPYLPSERTVTDAYGEHEMSEADHVELLECLAGIQGKFILSGYPSELYRTFAADHGWHWLSWDAPNQASSRRTKERKQESIWANFPLRDGMCGGP